MELLVPTLILALIAILAQVAGADSRDQDPTINRRTR
jgi:hypothetical protein